MFINGKAVNASKTFCDFNPAHHDVLIGKFQSGSRDHVRKAIAAARNAAPFWQELGWPARISFLRKAAELMTKHQFEVAALMTLEVGKNRTEAIAEVSESVDLILLLLPADGIASWLRDGAEHRPTSAPRAC